jgi:hypothetical protein
VVKLTIGGLSSITRPNRTGAVQLPEAPSSSDSASGTDRVVPVPVLRFDRQAVERNGSGI